MYVYIFTLCEFFLISSDDTEKSMKSFLAQVLVFIPNYVEYLLPGIATIFSLSNETQWESAYYYSILKFTKPINGMLGDVYVMALIKHILWLLLYMG